MQDDDCQPENPGSSAEDGPMQLDCRELFERYRQGDSTAAAEFVSLYRSPVFSFLLRWGLAAHSCDDLFQDVFAKIHVSRMSYDRSRSLPTWIFSIVVNVVRTHWANSKDSPEEYLEEVHSSDSSDPVERLSAKQWLERELPKLPAQQREVIILCCVHELSMEGAAESLNIPLNTAKTLLRRGRQTLTERYLKQKRSNEREVLV